MGQVVADRITRCAAWPGGSPTRAGLERRADWPERLAHALNAARITPFVWGQSDCCTWCASVVASLTGDDFAAPWRGRYFDADGAYALLDQLGGMRRMVSDRLGQPIDPLQAQRGDVVMARMPAGLALGIVVDERAAFRAVPRGLTFAPLADCRRAWRV